MRSSSGATLPTVHTSAHPTLPPAQPQQVVQFLLARNYYLTALELLVESQQAGKGEEVAELQRFFSDHDKFPTEELSKHQNANALDVQSQAREREERLQLAEYELRLAKEDLAEMNKRLTVALEQAARVSSTLSTNTSLTPDSVLFPGESASKNYGSNGVVGEPAPRKHSIAGGAEGEHAEVEARGVLFVDDSRPPTEQDLKAINSAVVTYLVKQGYQMSALTLEEEATDALDESRRMTNGSGGGDSLLLHSHHQQHNADLWLWLQAARIFTSHGCTSGAGDVQKTLQQHVLEVGQLQGELTDSKLRVSSLQADLRDLRRRTDEATAASLSSSLRARASDSGGARGNELPMRTSAASSSAAADALPSQNSHRSKSNDWPPVNPELHSAQSGVVLQLCELLPRITPNLTIKARMEVLPLLQSVILGVKQVDPSSQRALVNLVLNIVGNPDATQRLAIIGHLVPIASAFGPSWTAVELLPMLVKQVSSPSSEKRTTVAQVLGACVDLLDLNTQAHVVLTQLHRLAEDRIEQVREASVGAVTTLLSRMPFSKSYYMVVEDMVMALIRDPADCIHTALTKSLIPVMQSWVVDADVISTSLVPKVISEMARHMQSATATTSQDQASSLNGAPPTISMPGMTLTYSSAAAPSSPSPSPSLPVSGYGAVGGDPMGQHSNQRFPNHDYQVVYQLLGLYISLQPALRHSALASCPKWALAAAAETYSLVDPLAGGLPTTIGEVHVQEVHQRPSGAKPPRPVSFSSFHELADASSSLPTHRKTATEGSSLPSPHSEHAYSSTQNCSEGGDSVTGASTGNRLSLAGASSLGCILAMVDATSQEEIPPEALFAVWASSEKHMQWKSLQWVVQFLIPELLDAAKLVTPLPETLELRLQFARALGATCETYGSSMTRQVIIPLLAAASAAQQTLQPTPPTHMLGEAIAPHIQEAAMDLLPRNPETARMCRERVMPLFFGGVLPSAGVLGAYLSSTLSAADSIHSRWVLDSLAEIHLSVDFACEMHHGQQQQEQQPKCQQRSGPSSLVPELLQTLEQLVTCRSAATSMCAVALLRGLLRTASSEQMSKRVMPSIMVMLGLGDSSIHNTCAWALLDVLLLFRDDTKLVEQVFVVYDGLLNSGAHEVQMVVLACGSHLASATAVSASRSAAAAVQLEWLLSAVQSLARQLLVPVTGTSIPSHTTDQQRALAYQLVSLVQQVHSFNIGLPRLQSCLHASAESLHKCRAVLSETQLSTLAHILKDKNAFAPGAITTDTRGEAVMAPAATPPPASGAVGADDGGGGGVMARFADFRKKFRKGDAEQQMDAGRAPSMKPPAPPPQQPAPMGGLGHGAQGGPTANVMQSSGQTRLSSKSFLSDDEDD